MATKKAVAEKSESLPEVALTPELEELVEMLPQLKKLCEMVDQIEDLVDGADHVAEMTVWWWLHRNDYEKTAPKTEVSIMKFTGSDERKTVRVYPEVWDRWKQFCGMFPAYNEKDLMATALVEFMDRHSIPEEESKAQEIPWYTKLELKGTPVEGNEEILLAMVNLPVHMQSIIGGRAKAGEVKTVDDVKRIAESEQHSSKW